MAAAQTRPQATASSSNATDANQRRKATQAIPQIKDEVKDLTDLLKQYNDVSTKGDKERQTFEREMLQAVMASQDIDLKKGAAKAFYEGMESEFLQLRTQLSDDKKIILDDFLAGLKDEFDDLTKEFDNDNTSLLSKLDEQIEALKNGQTKTDVFIGDVKKAIRKPIPTSGKIFDAVLANSNPLIRIGVGLGRQFNAYMKDLGERSKKIDKVKLKELMDQRKALGQAANDDSNDEPKEKKERSGGERSLAPLIDRINLLGEQGDLTNRLLGKSLEYTAWNYEFLKKMAERDVPAADGKSDDQVTQSSMVKIEQDAADSISIHLLDINDTLEVLVGQTATMIELERDNQRAQQKAALQNLEALKEARKHIGADSGGKLTDGKGKDEGFLGHFLGTMFGAGMTAYLGRVFDGATKVLKLDKVFAPIKAFFSGGKGIGTIFEAIGNAFKFIGKLGGPLTKGLGAVLKGIPVIGEIIMVIDAVWDFFKGFLNAGEILGKEKVNLWDKISAGIGSLIGGLVGIIDFAAGLFGFDIKWGAVVKEKVAKFLAAIPEYISDAYDFLKDVFTDSYKTLQTGIKDIIDKLSTFFTEGIKNYAVAALKALPGGESLLNALGWASDKINSLSTQTPMAPVAPTTFPTDYKKLDDQGKALDDQTVAQNRLKAGSMAVQNNNVNASQTVINNTPLFTRNADDSARQSLATKAGNQF